MTETELRHAYVATAESYLGAKKYSAKHKKIVDTYNSKKPLPRSYALQYDDDWCAGSVSAWAIEAGIADIFPREVSCYYIVENAKKMGIWVENDAYVPSPGDCILYDWDDNGVGDNKGGSDHVGLVRYVKDGYIYVIEGNTQGSQVAKRQIAVNGKYIRGFICPKFASLATKSTTKATTTTKTKAATTTTKKEEISVTLTQLQKGSSGAQVKAMQLLLIGYGYSCGSAGADGDFGSSTQTALKKYQKAKGLTVDGVCGAKSWNQLLKG